MGTVLSEEIQKAFDEYASSIKMVRKQSGKLLLLSKLLEKVLGVKIENLALGAEKWLKDQVHGIKGSADVLHGGVVLEIKEDLGRELGVAEEELQRYLRILKNVRNEDYLGIATDGKKFIAYGLRDEKLKKISEISIDVGAEEFVIWLDSYLFTLRNLKPSANDLQIRFGLESSTFSLVLEKLLTLFKKVQSKPDVQLKYELWKKHLEIVYGKAPEIEEFVAHTYLVTLVKLIMFLRLQGIKKVTEIDKVLDGSYFREFGIVNLIEEDFFTWILDPEFRDETLKIVKKLIRELEVYDFEKADEDLFKEIYQDIIGPSARHRIGEYYTPEWLAKLTLLNALKFSDKEFPKILDPACGSGTFLTNAIHVFKAKLKNNQDALEKILTKIKGIDINPLAVIIARANYIIALERLILQKKGEISIPVYLADSIRLPQEILTLMEGKVYKLEICPEISFRFPAEVVMNEKLLSQILTEMKELSFKFRNNEIDEELAENVYKEFLQTLTPKLGSGRTKSLMSSFLNLLRLIKGKKDTIWLFIFKNLYAPVMMAKEKFDILVGNPPWIAYRYVENKDYQDFLKQLMFDYGLISPEEVKLFTHMEVATLFFRRCADLYLANNGIIAFVMPRSVLAGAKHYAKFKLFQNPTAKLLQIVDLHFSTSFKVEPLFNFPSCVLFARKGVKTEYPVKTIAYSGKIPKRNAKLEEVENILTNREYNYHPPEISREKSYYYNLFKQGASIVPRQFWLIDFVIDERLGINPDKPKVKSSSEALKVAHGIWKKKSPIIEDPIEKEFLFVTLLSKDLKPFGFEKLRPLILPAMIVNNKLTLLSESQLKKLGFLETAKWLTKAQKYWRMCSSEKDKENFPNITQRLDYQRYLSSQDLSRRFIVLYPTSGTYLISTVIDRRDIEFRFHGVRITNFVADTTTYLFETNNENEAYYLSSVLNSNVIDDLIKPIQTVGLGGKRHIHRRPFEFAIPKFDPKNEIHLKLAELSKKCHQKVKTLNIKGRRKVKEALSEYLEEIDSLVKKIIF